MIYILVHAPVHIRECLWTCIHVSVDVTTYSLPYFLRKGLSLNLELEDSARLAGQQVPGILLSLLSQHGDSGVCSHAQF